MATIGVQKDLKSLMGQRFLAVAKVQVTSGGVASVINGFPGLSIARGAAGTYSLAYPVLRDGVMKVDIVRATGASGIHRCLPTRFDPKASGLSTGTALFLTVGANGAAQDPADGDILSIWFYATESDSL